MILRALLQSLMSRHELVDLSLKQALPVSRCLLLPHALVHVHGRLQHFQALVELSKHLLLSLRVELQRLLACVLERRSLLLQSD